MQAESTARVVFHTAQQSSAYATVYYYDRNGEPDGLNVYQTAAAYARSEGVTAPETRTPFQSSNLSIPRKGKAS